jgi:predicted sulfurtransferase
MKKFPGKHFKGSLFVFDNRMVAPIVDIAGREIIGRCFYCNAKCEEFYNDDSIRPSKKVICCDICIVRHSTKLRRCIPVV